jgi:hypothetical protein
MTIADKDLVKHCLKELAQKMGYAEGQRLSQSDLEHLCYLIGEKSKIVLSLSTMKRLFQEKFERLPQISTLDAITIFLGYSGWRDFKAKKSNDGLSEVIASRVNTIEKPAINRWRPTAAVRYALVAAGVLLFVFSILWSIWSDIDNEADAVAFSVKKVVSENVPKNVIFNYNIDGIRGDSFFIQPSWNEKIKVKISRQNYTQTETYFEPGYHTAKLICDGRVLKKVAVHIPTEDWIGYSKVRFTDPYPEYFNTKYIIRDHILGIDEDGLKASNLNFEKNKIYYFSHFPDSLNVNSQDFTLKAKIRIKNPGNTLCPWIVADVFTENSFFYFMGTTPGCSSEIHAVFSDKNLNGKTNDLSALGFDVLKWNEIRMDVKGNSATVYINSEKVLETTYSRHGGNVHGMGFGSNGLCEIDWVELTDSAGNVAYFNDFEQDLAQR